MDQTPTKAVMRKKAESPSEPIADDRTDLLGPEQLGARIRQKRLTAGLTLAALAERSGFGKGYLSRIENGKKTPPIATLARIADVLGIEAASVLSPSENPTPWRGVSVVRRTEKRPTVLGGSAFGYDYFAITNATDGRALQPFVFSFPAAVDKFVFFEHEGEELIHVLSGRIEWQVGMDKYILGAGDTIHFDSRIPHKGHSISGPATALVVMYSPVAHGANLA